MQNAKYLLSCLVFLILGIVLSYSSPMLDYFHPTKIVTVTLPAPPPEVIKQIIEVPAFCDTVVKYVSSCKKEKSEKVISDVLVKDESMNNSAHSISSKSDQIPVKESANLVFLRADYGYNSHLGFYQNGDSGYAYPNRDITVGIQYDRKFSEKIWGTGSINLRGDFDLGIGYGF
jgi:hypothetical protein